jgi:hypothetical protein
VFERLGATTGTPGIGMSRKAESTNNSFSKEDMAGHHDVFLAEFL